MALTNRQFDEISREFDRKRTKALREQEERVEQVRKQIPELVPIEEKIISLYAAQARFKLDGQTGEAEELGRKIAALRSEKQRLLAEADIPEDYDELKSECPFCGDTGFVNGEKCSCFKQAEIRLLYHQSRMDRILERENFDTFDLSCYDREKVWPGEERTPYENAKRTLEACRQFVREFPEKGGNLLLIGETGVGKTFLLHCIAKALLDQRVPVVYLSAQEMFDILSRSYFRRDDDDDAEETDTGLFSAQVLIIDDLDTEMNNSFTSSQLFACLNRRAADGLSTLISTNLSGSRLQEEYSGRIVSRIVGNYKVLALYGADIRKLKAQR